MGVAYSLLMLLVASPMLNYFVEWPGLLGLRLIVAGIVLALTIGRLDNEETTHLKSTVGPLALLGLLLAIWLLVQVAPNPVAGNPVWASAAEALGTSGKRHISVDLGATLTGLGSLTLWMLLAVATATLSIDRLRAERLLVVLTVVTLACGCVAYVNGAPGAPEKTWGAVHPMVSISAALGSLMCLGCADLAYERYETRHARRSDALTWFCFAEAGCLLSFSICVIALVATRNPEVLLAWGLGLTTIVALLLARRLSFGVWLGGAVAVVFTVLAAGLLRDQFEQVPKVDDAHQEFYTRLAHDAPTFGFGAGASGAMTSVYRTLGGPASLEPPTAAFTWRIELGAPIFWAAMAGAAFIGFFLVRGSLRRGRDSAYALTGAAVTFATLGFCFVDEAVQSSTVALVTSGVLGLALAQARPRGAS